MLVDGTLGVQPIKQPVCAAHYCFITSLVTETSPLPLPSKMHFVTSLIAGVAMLATASATVQGGAPVDDLKFAKKFNQNCQQISGGPNG